MLIDLYKDNKLVLESSKNLALLRTRKCDIQDDLSYYQQEVACSLDSHFHISSVLGNKDAPREYKEYFGKIADSHNEIEKLGVCKYTKNYTTIVSLEDSLDYILHRLCKAQTSNVRQIRGYSTLSRALLKLNFEGLQGLTMDTFFGVDANLEEFILSLYAKLPEDQEDRDKYFLLDLIRMLIMEVSSVSEYVSFYYNSNLERDSSVVRSKSLCSFVLTTNQKLDDQIIIKSEGFDDYAIRVHSFERKEYLSGLDLKYAE